MRGYHGNAKKIQEWLPTATLIFKRFMPPTDIHFPSVHIVSEKALFSTRAKLVEKLRCHQKNCDEKYYDSIMEMLQGELGDAILIRQKDLPNPKTYMMAEAKFQHFFGTNWNNRERFSYLAGFSCAKVEF